MTRVAPDMGGFALGTRESVTSLDVEEEKALERVAQKRAAQHSENQAAAVQWLETVLGQKLPHESLHESLKSGVILCHVMNKLKPGSIPLISTRNMPFMQMENINRFLNSCANLGLKGHELFQTVDLFEAKDMQQVVVTILTLARVMNNQKSRPADTDASNPPLPIGAGLPSRTVDPVPFYYNDLPVSTPSTDEILAYTPVTPAVEISQSETFTLMHKPEVPSFSEPVEPSIPNDSPADLDDIHFESGSEALREGNEKDSSPPSNDTKDLVGVSNSILPPLPAIDTATLEMQKMRVHGKSMSTSHMGNTRPPKVGPLMGVKRTESDKQIKSRTESPPYRSSSSRPGSRGSSMRGKGPALTVGNYQLGSCIGKGQFGSVYQALNIETGQVAAIKRIPLADRKDRVEDLMQEVELLKSLEHPNIVKYLGFVQEDKYLNIVLEYMECGSLQSIMRKFNRVIPERLAAVYVEHILEGLSYLHEKGVVHCDLKCANILTTKDSTVKLSDFGVSKQLNGVGEDEQAVAGTPYWMAPEIIELKGASTASDIWSLGCTIIEMIDGRPPYLELKNPMTALFRIVEDEHPPMPEDISEELEDFFMKCFQRDIGERWTANQLLKHDWIRLKYKDPKTAQESAMLLEGSARLIEQSTSIPAVPGALDQMGPSMDTIPEPNDRSLDDTSILNEPRVLSDTSATVAEALTGDADISRQSDEPTEDGQEDAHDQFLSVDKGIEERGRKPPVSFESDRGKDLVLI